MKKVFVMAALVLACATSSYANEATEVKSELSEMNSLPVKKTTKKTTKKATTKTTAKKTTQDRKSVV